MQLLSSTVSSHLKKRLLSHSGEKLFSCSQCSFSCTQAGNLKIHNRTHSGRKGVQLWSMQLFNRSVCSSESTHAQAHWGKTFNQCNYSSIQAGNLENHIQTHSGEKLFKCYECNYWGSEASRVKVHKRQHTGENRSNAEAGKVKVHKQKHTGEKLFKCHQCNFSCNTSSRLRRHVMKKRNPHLNA